MVKSNCLPVSAGSTGQMSRRQLLRAGSALGFGALLAACSGSGQGAGVSSAGNSGSESSATTSTSEASSARASGPSGAVVLDDATSTTLDAVFDKTFAASGLAGMAAGVWIGADAWQ